MFFLRQSTAVDIAIGPFLDSTDGVTAETGLTISQADVRLKKNNGAWAQVNDATAATHEENGWYEKELDATDTNTVGQLIIAVAESGALPVWHEFQVVEEAVFDALFAASALGYVANAPVNVAQFGGTNGTFASGRPEVNTTHAAGTAWGSGAITAASIASDAITAAKIADNAIDAGAIATGAITSAKFAAGAIDNAAIAADAIGASELATSAVDEIVDAVWDEVLSGATHNVAGSAGRRLRELAGSIVTSGTAQGGATASITLASGASSTDGTYDPAIVRIVAGTGLGQARLIIQYVGSTRVASVDRDWRVTPDNTSEYEIIATQNLISTNEGLAQGGGSNTITLNANASATDDVYVGQTVVLRTGTGQDQSRIITDYNGTTKVATVATAWQTNPASGTGYILWPLGRARVTSMEADTLTASALAADAVTEIQSGLSTLNAAGVRSAVGLASANLDAQLDALPTAAETADAVWEEAIADHSGTSGSTAEALAAAGAAGDPWITALPGSYSAGQAGFIIGTNLNATVGSRATQTSVDDLPTNAELATALASADDAVLTAIADLPTNSELATALDAIPTATENADALLNRDMSAVTDSTARSPLNALRFLRNRWSTSGGTLTVYKENDSTTAWTGAVETTPGADPVTGSDPS